MKIGRFAALVLFLFGSLGCMEPQDEHMTAQEIFADRPAEELASAACAGDVDRVKNLIADGVDVNVAGRFGVTPLIWALTCRGLQFNDLIANEVVANGTSERFKEPDTEYLGALQALLQAGADPNSIIDGEFGPVYPGADKFWIDGYTPVLIAAEFHQPEVLSLLLENGGDPDSEHADGETTALLLAYSRGNWLDLGTQRAPFDARQWRNMYILIDAGAELGKSPANQSNIVERASRNRIAIADNLLRNYNYNGGYETVVYNLIDEIKTRSSDTKDREDLLEFLKNEKRIDIEKIRRKYWKE